MTTPSSTAVPASAPSADREPVAAHMRRAGIDRRTVLRWSAYMAGILALPTVPFAARIAEAMESQPRLPVLWLNGQDCNGDIEALLRASRPTPSELILDQLSLEYVELLMAASGDAAEGRLAEAVSVYAGRYVVVVEGSIPLAENGAYCCVGGRAFVDIVKEAAAGALAVIAVGSCAADGGLPGARGGVTGAASVSAVLAGTGAKIINFPGCPMNAENITATLVQYLTLGAWPDTDAAGAPLFAYGARIHPTCERLPFFRAGQFALEWGDAGHRAGWCLRQIGCQGPRTYGNCQTVKFNSGTSWPVAAGTPCFGCTRAGFWDLLDPAFAWVPPVAAEPGDPTPSPAPSASPSASAGPGPSASASAEPSVTAQPSASPAVPALAGSR